MSVVPLMFRDWWEDFERERPSRIMDQQFGLGLRRDDLLSSLNSFPSSNTMFRNSYFRPWRAQNLTRQESASTINLDKEKFQVILDIQQFLPNEITVKTVNNCVIVEGKHEEKQDEHGFISRQFTRRYILPQGHDVNDVLSSLSSDGVLTITSPKKTLPPPGTERVVPITQTGPSKQQEVKVETSN
ncbi:lethal (2) essential for life [Arctopsyche grandis]|uniref:lethal (2) essential for life n=1 Tax=Arctopsyche grandis TaxID=121162 RepID=UPI00406D6D65